MAGIAASDADLVALLMRQHGDIRNLFDEVGQTTGDERRDAPPGVWHGHRVRGQEHHARAGRRADRPHPGRCTQRHGQDG